MKTGMLWFDNDPNHSLAEKIDRAATRYREKYGHVPTIVYANAGDVDERKQVDEGIQKTAITLKKARSILPNHLWLGVEDPGGKAA